MAKAKRKTKAKGKAQKKAKGKAQKKAKAKPAPIPKGYHSVTPYLIVKNAADAISFYSKAFGAKEKGRMEGPGGSIAHAEIQIGDSRIMLAEENPQWGSRSPQSLGGSPVSVFLYVKNVDDVFQKAIAAGATAKQPVQDMFWGDRYGKLADPFGHSWDIATHVEDVSNREMGKRAAQFFEQAPGGGA